MEVEQLIFRVDLHIKRILNTPIASNCFVLHLPNFKDCIIIDPGSKDNSALIAYLNKNELTPTIVILTHEHFDHIWGVISLSNYYKFKLICNKICANAIVDSKKNLSIFYDNVGFSILNKVSTVEMLNHELSWNGKHFKLLQTPGHSEGSICIQLEDVIFCGDLLIQNEKTVTKLPGGSLARLKETVENLKSNLSPETLIHSGHGDSFLFKNYYIFSEL